MSIRLSWVNRVEADEIRIYRDTATIDPNSLPAPLATIAGTALEYIDDAVSNGTTYYYRVAAVLTAASPDLVAVSEEISVLATGGAASPSPSPSPSVPITAGTGFRATRVSTGIALSPSVFKVMDLNSVDDDTGGFDTSTGRFTVPASLNGKYARFSAGAVHNTGSNGFGTYISRNGTALAQNVTGDVSSASYAFGHTVLGPVLLVTGDYYEAGFFNTTGGTIVVDEGTFFAMEVLD